MQCMQHFYSDHDYVIGCKKEIDMYDLFLLKTNNLYCYHLKCVSIVRHFRCLGLVCKLVCFSL